MYTYSSSHRNVLSDSIFPLESQYQGYKQDSEVHPEHDLSLPTQQGPESRVFPFHDEYHSLQYSPEHNQQIFVEGLPSGFDEGKR